MAAFSGIIEADYRLITLDSLAAVANQTATDWSIRNKYFADMTANR